MDECMNNWALQKCMQLPAFQDFFEYGICGSGLRHSPVFHRPKFILCEHVQVEPGTPLVYEVFVLKINNICDSSVQFSPSKWCCDCPKKLPPRRTAYWMLPNDGDNRGVESLLVCKCVIGHSLDIADTRTNFQSSGLKGFKDFISVISCIVFIFPVDFRRLFDRLQAPHSIHFLDLEYHLSVGALPTWVVWYDMKQYNTQFCVHGCVMSDLINLFRLRIPGACGS